MRTFIKTYSIAILLLFFSACKISKDIAVPTTNLQQTFRNTATTDGIGIATIPWKDFFTNLSLLELIDSAIVHNYDMQVALNRIAAAKLIVQQSKLAYLPEATLQASATFNRPSDNSLNGLSLSQFLGKSYVEDYTLSATISWEADIWGKIKAQNAKVLAAYLQTGEVRKVIQTNLVSFIAKGYYNLLMLDAQVAVAKKNLLLNDSTLRIIQLQFDAGQVTALAIQQATAQRLVAAILVPAIEKEIVLQENALSVLAGVNPAAIKRNGTIEDVIFPGTIAAGVPASLLQNRPDIKLKELELNIANANTGIAQANMYPSLRITATGGVNSFKASNWFNIPASLFGAIAGGITQPIFQRKQLKTNYELSKLDREKVVTGFRQTVLVAVAEVSDALVKLEKLKIQQDFSAQRVNILQTATGNAALLFKNGMANYLEVITAQANVLQAELELVILKKEQANAMIELYRSLGGGWK